MDEAVRPLAASMPRYACFVTSGHAAERDWQIGFGYENGQFRSGGSTPSWSSRAATATRAQSASVPNQATSERILPPDQGTPFP